MKFRKKPLVIEAEQWWKDGDNIYVDSYMACFDHDPQMDCNICGNPYINHGYITTLEGRQLVCPGDWIITGVKNEKYPCKPDIFELTYELFESEMV